MLILKALSQIFNTIFLFMDFKIDTKATYTNIKPPVAALDAIMTESIRQKWYSLLEEGCQNMILDLENCESATEEGILDLKAIHEDSYGNNRSFIIIKVSQKIEQQINKYDTAHNLAIVPTINEAVDMVNMEILERDLFNEE
jgi:hypothetical protein